MADFRLQTGANTLAATLSQPANPNGEGVLFIHGWRSSRHSPAHYVDRLLSLGYTCLTFDLPGMGDSEGSIDELTSGDFVRSTWLAYDRLREAAETIHVVGSSFGSYLAARLVAEREVASLVLRVPADFALIPDEQPGQLGAGIDNGVESKTGGLTPDDPLTEPQVALRAFDGPVLIVESELDDLVLAPTVQRYRNSAHQHQYELMRRFHHSLQTDEEHDAFGSIVAGFLNNGQHK